MNDQSTYTFNWHDLKGHHDDYEAFLKWALTKLIVNQRDVDANRHNTELLEQLRTATNEFTEVTLTVQVNGVEVDPEHMMRAIEHNMRSIARETARDELERLTAFTDLRNTLTTLEAAANRRVRQVASALNVELRDEEDR